MSAEQVTWESPPPPAVYMSMASTWVCHRPIIHPSSLSTGWPSRIMQTSVVVPPTSTIRAVASLAVQPKRAVAAGPLAMVMAARSTASSRFAPLPLPQMIVTGQLSLILSMDNWMEERKPTISGISLACRHAVAARARMPGWSLTWWEQKTGLGSSSLIASSATSSWAGFLMDMAPQTA